MITQEELKETIIYDPSTGIFRWNKRISQAIKKGEIAGALGCNGYLRIKINHKPYMAHRLAFLYMSGKYPEGEVDHINNIRSDNRWSNLRDVSHRVNSQNRIDSKKIGKTPGVFFHKRLKNNPWESHIQIDGVIKSLGCFPTQELAYAEYLKAIPEKENKPKYLPSIIRGNA